jgi:Sulfotransferase family
MSNEATTKAARGAQLRQQDLLEQARGKTGLDDFGDPWFLEPLKALVHFVNTEAGLATLDVTPVHHIVDMLCDRLRLMDYLKRHPKVLDEKLEFAGVILGQARGGSTLTQRLTAQSPQLTTTYLWELFTPVPLATETPGDPVERRKIGDDVVASWSKAMPAYKGMHPLNSNYFEEEIWLMDRAFNCYMYNIHFNIPGYHKWALTQDHTKVYEEQNVWFKLLQYTNPARREKKWLLKNQHHIMTNNLPLMFKMFPGVKAIQTHRSMDEALTSLCSIQSTHISASGSTTFDRKELGGRIIDQYLIAMHHMMDVRRKMPENFIDIRYRDLVADPIGQYRKMIEGMGLVCGADDVAAATAWMSKNQRGTHPPHEYRAEDYGLTARQLKDTFKFYHDEFLN